MKFSSDEVATQPDSPAANKVYWDRLVALSPHACNYLLEVLKKSESSMGPWERLMHYRIVCRLEEARQCKTTSHM